MLNTPIEISEITDLQHLEALRPEWNRLLETSPQSTPFQTPEWLIAWWKLFGQGKLWVLPLWREGRLAGMAPMFIHPRPNSSLREVLFIGTGVSDYLDVLFEPGFEIEGVEALSHFLEARSDEWDVCDFQQLHDSPIMRMPVPPGWVEERGIQEVCPVLTLPQRVEELGLFVPVHQLENLRYNRSRAQKTGPLSYVSVDPTNFEQLIDVLFSLHRARAEMRSENGLLADPDIQAFHREVAHDLLNRGILRLEVLKVGDRNAAVFYGFNWRRRVYYYLGGFDPEFAHLSLGSMIVGRVIESSIQEGFSEFDFMRGRESYKYLWGARDRLNYRRRLFRDSSLAYRLG